MSTFGDRTPLQTLLEYAENVQQEFKLNNNEMAILVSHLLTHILDPYNEDLSKIQKKPSIFS